MGSSRRLAILVGVVLTAAGLARALVARRVDDVPFRRAFGRWRIGADWATRRGLESEPAVGEIDDFGTYDRGGGTDASDEVCERDGSTGERDGSTFDREGFDSSVIHPEIRRFYEQTVEYDLSYETRWHRGFRLGAWLASFATSRLEQLNLPGTSDGTVRRLESRLALLPEPVDSGGSPRETSATPRVWIRTDPDSGKAVFVAIYTTHTNDRTGVTYANVAVPLPWSNLSTVLAPETLECGCGGETGGKAVRFTTREPRDGDSRDGDGGLFLVTPLGAFWLPMEQSFSVWPAGCSSAPRAPISDPDLVATHEMWLFDRQFLTIRYGLDRSVSQ